MNFSTKGIAVLVLSLSAGTLSNAVLAGPILAEDSIAYIEASPTPLNTDPVTDPGGNPVGSIAHNDGFILLEDWDGDALTTYTPNPSWWNAPGVAYTTTTSGIEITFDNLNVTGFTFNIGANMNANAWIEAHYDDGIGNTLKTGWFGGIGPSSTPSYGVYIKDPLVSCANITKIVVDPTFEWGIGNFGLAESSCSSVPAPSTTNLLSISMLIVGLAHCAQLMRRRRVLLRSES